MGCILCREAAFAAGGRHGSHPPRPAGDRAGIYYQAMLPLRLTRPHPLARLLALLLPLLLLAALAPAARAQPNSPKPAVSCTLNTKELIPGGQAVLAVIADVPPGFHAQSAKPLDEFAVPFVVALDNVPKGLTTRPVVYPLGVEKTFATQGKLSIYEGRAIAYIPLVLDADLPVGSTVHLTGTVASQLCDEGTCFPPSSVPFDITAKVIARDATPTPTDPAVFKGFSWSAFSTGATTQAAPGSTTVPATGTAAKPPSQPITVFGFELPANSFFFPMGAAFVVGLIFNVMPCVLPVLPLKAVGFIQAAEHSRARAVELGVAFSAGLISVFGALGLFIFLGGNQWGFLFQQAWFAYAMSGVLVLFAASQWGLWTFRLPLGVYTVEPSHDTYVGNYLFGGLTALLSTPCTAPVFPALLLWSATQPKFIGISLLLMTGVGMALPYFLLSCFPELARKVPRTGAWSEIVKQFMGFLVLGTAAYLTATHLLSYEYLLVPVAVVGLAASIFLVIRTRQLMPRPRPTAIAWTLALLLTASSIYAALPTPTTAAAGQTAPLVWIPFSDEALAAARASKQTIVIDFTATWCPNCHYIENTVYTHPEVINTLREGHVVLLKVDITNANAPGSTLLTHLNPIGGIPLTAIYFPGAEEAVQLQSIYTKDTLLKTLSRK
jgi:thiol:disulfide interchange protein DsbD